MPAATTVTPEQIAHIVELRDLKGPNGKSLHTYKKIAEMAGVTKAQAEYFYHREFGPPRKTKVIVVDVNDNELPMTMINGGEMWIQPVQPPLGRYGKNHYRQSSCDFCPLREQCDEAIARWCSDFIGCERPIEREIK